MDFILEERVEKARDLFRQGYNCSQSVFLAYNDLLGVESTLAATISGPLGGGMGRLREVCGAVSGMFMVAGAICGYHLPMDKEGKTRHYATVQQLAAMFRQKNGSIVCRDLLGAKLATTNPQPDERTPEYYRTRPCARLVGDCADILSEYFNIL